MGQRDRARRLLLLLLLRRYLRLRLLLLCRAFALLEGRSAESHYEDRQRWLDFATIVLLVGANLTAYFAPIALIPLLIGARVALDCDNGAVLLHFLDDSDMRYTLKVIVGEVEKC